MPACKHSREGQCLSEDKGVLLTTCDEACMPPYQRQESVVAVETHSCVDTDNIISLHEQYTTDDNFQWKDPKVFVNC